MDKKSSVLAGILLVASFTFAETGMNYVNQNEEKTTGSASIPSDVQKILQNSCFDCHTKGGKKMAMSHVNFSVWDNYSEEKKEKKSADIVRMLIKGAMPPKLYRQSHPDKIPTSDQVTLISQWAETLKKNK
jgi:mono/diheme cytochrome c family protein